MRYSLLSAQQRQPGDVFRCSGVTAVTATYAAADIADQATTLMGSPMWTVSKYHAALSGLRLMQPWLTFE